MSGRVLRAAATSATSLAVLLTLVACGDGAIDLVPEPEPCVTVARPLALGATATGALDYEQDCLQVDGRLADEFTVELTEATAFTITLSTSGYFPLMPAYRDSVQVSGWGSSSTTTLTREHLFPAGTYRIRASSFGREGAPGAPTGPYTLSTAALERIQEGCGRETSITYGSVAIGRIDDADCRDGTAADSATAARLDGYDFLLQPGRSARVRVVADFPYRFVHWDNGRPIEVVERADAGVESAFAASGIGFHDFYIMDLSGGGGGYTMWFEDAG